MKKMLILGAAVALTTSLALAQGMMGHGMMGAGPGMMMNGGPMMASLKLTDEQEDKLFAIQEQHHAKNFGAMSQMRAESYKLRRMLKAENVDTKAVVEQQKKVDELRRTMMASHLDMRKDVEKILTPEQRKQFRDFGPWEHGATK